MKAIIIGSGVAGLTVGAFLARAGWQVTVLEQFERPGGVTGRFERDGFRWDLGQLLVEGFGPGEPTGKILADLDVAKDLTLRRDDRGYVFPDFELRKPADYQGLRWRIERMKQLFPAEAAGLERYWQDQIRFTRLMTRARQLDGVSGAAGLAAQARMYSALLPFLTRLKWSAAQLMDSYFQSDQLKCVFISILADFFTPPSQFQGLGVFALNAEASFESRMETEIAPGARQLYHYSIIGGIQTLVTALVNRIESAGGQVLTGCAAQRILMENGRASAVVTTDGRRFDADVVAASGGARELFFNLVGKEHLPAGLAARVESIPLMDSVLMVHLGLRDFDPRPAVHGVCTYYYGTYDVESGITRAHEGQFHEGADGFVVHVPTLHTPGMAPEGHHAMTIYTIAPDQLKNGDWSEQREALADRLVACAEQRIPGLSQHVVAREVLTPADFRARLHTQHHAFGGIAPIIGSWKASHRTPLPGLWFVGQQSESGGGVSSVMAGAARVAQQIIAGK